MTDIAPQTAGAAGGFGAGGQTAPFSLAQTDAVFVASVITAVAGTTPSLRVFLDVLQDGNWTQVAALTAQAAAGVQSATVVTPSDASPTFQLRWTVTRDRRRVLRQGIRRRRGLSSHRSQHQQGRGDMPRMTKDQYDSGLDAIYEAWERGPAQRPAVLNQRLAAFKATASITETSAAPAPPTACRPAATVKVKGSRKAARIARAVRETLAAAAAPQPPPTAAPRPAAGAHAAARPLAELTADELAAASMSRLAGSARSPFWRGVRESAPPAPITETEAASVAADLASLSDAGLARVYDAQARRAGHCSPIWAA